MSTNGDGTGQGDDDGAVPTVGERLRTSGMSAERIEMHRHGGTLALDGTPVTDLDQPAPPGTRINFLSR